MVRERTTSDPHKLKAALSSGGPAASGGFSFQAVITSIAGAHALADVALGWLDGLIFDAPVSLAAETGSGGDDLRLRFIGGEVADAQVKKGLRAGKDLTEGIDALVDALAAGTINYGLLVVDPDSSRSIREGFAGDLRRLAEAPTALVGAFAEALRSRLLARGLDVLAICGRLRIVTVPALDGNDAAVRTAIAHLGRVCRCPQDAPNAWDRLYRDSHLMMSQRGMRTRVGLADLLRSANIALSNDPAHGPAALLTRLCDWTLATTAQFSILGVAKPLQIDNAWIPLTAVVRDLAAVRPQTLTAALVDYHEPPPRNREDDEFDATTLGRFRRLAVVVGGPGSGKTILLKRLARAYARDGHPVLRVNAKAVVRRMADLGEGFLTAAFELGLEGSSLAPAALRAASLGNWVLLCDGLDECGAQQQEIAEGLLRVAAGEPAMRIVATTRPIGYRPTTLSAWRHYDLALAGVLEPVQKITELLGSILPIEARDHLRLRVEEALKENDAGKTAARSPLLLGLCAALFASGLPLGRTRPQFYRAIFALIEAEPPPRAPSPPATPVVRNRFLDVLGWTLIRSPQVLANDAVVACAKVLKLELDIPALKAHDLAEFCLAWWQALGVVEQLHYSDEPVLTFVHKTFGEFAAGRYLSDLPDLDQKRILEAEPETSVLSEVIGFGSALGAAPVFLDDLTRRGFDGPQGQDRLLQAIDIIGEARPPLDEGRINSVVTVAVTRIASTHRSWALQAASVLIDVAPAVATQIAPRLPPLCSSEHLWTRLSAWALRVFVEGQRLDLDGLTEILHGFSGVETREALSSLEGMIIAGRHSGRDLVHRMALKITERMLQERPANESRAWIEGLRDFIWSGTYGFFLSLRDLARPYGLVLPDPTWTRAKGLAEIGEADLRQRAAITALLESISTGGVWHGPSGRTLYHLAAFFELIKLRDQTLPDIWVWRHPFDRPAVAAVFRAFATLANLPLDALASDSATLLGEMAEAAKTDSDSFPLLFARTPAVDTEEFRLKRDIPLDIDFPTVERALRHPSAAAVAPALNVALAMGTSDDWRGAAIRLLADGQGNTLWAAAELAKRLPQDESVVLLLNHLASPPRLGTTYVIKALKDLGVGDHHMRKKALRSALFGTSVEVAIGAAAWLKAVPNPNVDERSLVQAAFDHWLTHEGPYPSKGGGIVPPSPRDDLTSALYGMGALDLSTLRHLTEDTRPDVANAARVGLIDLIARDAGARTQFVNLAQTGAIAPATLRKVLERPEVFALDETRQLLTLLNSSDARTRLTVMAILDWPSVDTDTRRTFLVRLREDSVPDISELAIRMSG